INTSSVLASVLRSTSLSSSNTLPLSFPYVNVITLLQLICSSLFLYTLRRWKIISFAVDESLRADNNKLTLLVPYKTLLQTLPLALSYLLFMLVSMASVRGVNVPMYATLRRTTVAFTMVVEYLVARQKYSRRIVASVGVIILGAFVAGARDLSFDLYGYAVVLVSNICTAVYLASIARLGKSSGLNSFGLMWCNGIICGPILLIWTFLQGDLQMLLNFPYLSSPGFQAVMLLSCIMAFFLNYTVFWNTALNSALTQTICGNLKDVFTIGLGWLLFGGLPFDWFNILGQGLGLFGSCLYAYYKFKGQ
ncbi:UDP-N-acetylglucosamine transporter UGNT1-like, partial [Silene latifolia]|uniref:UDP-N-acetylglucosamine transporter UGNT1-like n=1 Tax=Silene latifolia TaxID=37657 RepID=UPI003D77E90F